MKELQTKESPGVAEFEKALIGGDMSGLSPEQRVIFYKKTCDSLKLNYLTSPFAYIKMRDGKLKLYALKDCTEQLRKIHQVSISALDVVSNSNGLYAVRATGFDGTGRTDSSLGAVAAGHLKGEDLANAMMKAETKAKRRFTLSICGLSMLDESELDGMKGCRIVSAAEAHSTTIVTGELVGGGEPLPPQPPVKPTERFFRFAMLADEQRHFLESVGEYREDVKVWVLPGTLPANVYKKIESSEIAEAQLEAEMLQQAAAAASGAGEIEIEPASPQAPQETPLQKAKKRADAMKQNEHVTGALAKLEQLKQQKGA